MSKRAKVEKDAVFNGWKLIELLGEGGNGEVWKAVNTEQKKMVQLSF
ncbi:hypothetical protein [Aliivibrio fischeri]|nr:hypothetical protein [Aliivibrio fischeri]